MSHQGVALPAAPAQEKESTRRGSTRRVAPPPGGGRWRQRLEVAFFVSPALALMAVFVVWPIVSAVRMSFYRWKVFGPMEDFVGLLNDELALSVKAEDIGRGLDTVESWDSVHLLALCTILERETGRPLSLADVLEAPSLEALYLLAVSP